MGMGVEIAKMRSCDIRHEEESKASLELCTVG